MSTTAMRGACQHCVVCTSIITAMAERGGCSHSVNDFMCEITISQNALLYRDRACTRCGQPACLELIKKRFRCDKAMAVRKQKRKKYGWSASLFMGSIFERTHLNFETLLIFVTYFVQERFTYQFKLHELGLSPVSFTDWSIFY